MRCVYCGKENEARLCDEHRTVDVLGELLAQLAERKPMQYSNPNIADYVDRFDSPHDAWTKGFPELLGLFDESEVEYERCYYLGSTKTEGFEKAALAYLDSHPLTDKETQEILLKLFSVSKKGYDAPLPYTAAVFNERDLYCEIYRDAAEHLGHIGDYDDARRMVIWGREQALNGSSHPRYGIDDAEKQADLFDKLEKQIDGWESKKPYRPRDPDDRLRILSVYKAKGIDISNWNPYEKVKERDFSHTEPVPGDFKEACLVRLDDTVGPRGVRGIWRISAEAVTAKGEVLDSFETLVKPWDGSKHKADAVVKSGFPPEAFERATRVEYAVRDLVSFAEDRPLLLVGDLDKQVALLERAARYAGLKKLPCGVLDPKRVDAEMLHAMLEGLGASATADTGADVWEKAPDYTWRVEMPSFDSFVAFDIEHTGTYGRKAGDKPPAITEIGAVRVTNGVITERFSKLANPGRPIVPIIARKTGITDAMVSDADPLPDVVRLFHEFVGDDILVGHNIFACDIPHINRAAAEADVAFTNLAFDTLPLARSLRAEQGWSKVSLGYLAEQLGVELNNAHRAWADAEATAAVYLRLKELARE